MNELATMDDFLKPFPVDARELHARLGAARDFSTWIKERIERFGFNQSLDYAVYDSPDRGNQTGRGGDRRSVDYALTLASAKMIAAIENTDQGKVWLAKQFFPASQAEARHG